MHLKSAPGSYFKTYMSNELHQNNDRAERRAPTDAPVFSGETVMYDADAAALANGRTMANDPLPEYTSYPGDASWNHGV